MTINVCVYTEVKRYRGKMLKEEDAYKGKEENKEILYTQKQVQLGKEYKTF